MEDLGDNGVIRHTEVHRQDPCVGTWGVEVMLPVALSLDLDLGEGCERVPFKPGVEGRFPAGVPLGGGMVSCSP